MQHLPCYTCICWYESSNTSYNLEFVLAMFSVATYEWGSIFLDKLLEPIFQGNVWYNFCNGFRSLIISILCRNMCL